VRTEAMPMRREWVAAYDAKSAGFAAARFENEIGTGNPHDSARAVQWIHDELCRASDGLPIA